jgi:osmotically-inducible protein OsmY
MLTTTLTDRTDEAHVLQLVQDVMQKLRQVPYASIHHLSCECNAGGVVVLRGRLFSFYHKQLAQEAVAKVAGVARVVNEIEVVAARGGPR